MATKYITDTFNKFVFASVKKLQTNDDLYDECTRCVEASKGASEVDKLVNSVAYAEIAYRFRLKKLKASEESHGNYFISYKDPVDDAAHNIGCARDRLMDYCKGDMKMYLSLLQ